MKTERERADLVQQVVHTQPARAAAVLGDLVGVVTDEDILQQALHRCAELARSLVDGCDAAGVTIVRDGRAVTAACTDTVTLAIDQRQYAEGEGPCLEAARTGTPQRAGTPESARRWPAFTEAARSAGIHSFLAAPLPGPQGPAGALNLYARRPGAFDALDQQLVEVLAGRTGDLVAAYLRTAAAERLADQMQQAMRSRAVIEQAKGILMARHGVDDEGAFDMLRRESQLLNVKLRDVARALVAQARIDAEEPAADVAPADAEPAGESGGQQTGAT